MTALHREGRKVICYLSTGAWEDWRPDAKKFPKSVIGARQRLGGRALARHPPHRRPASP